jgi:hypothetical protein
VVVGGRLTASRVVTMRVVGYRDAVFLAEMPYGVMVGTAFAPLIIGIIFIAVAARQGRRRRH